MKQVYDWIMDSIKGKKVAPTYIWRDNGKSYELNRKTINDETIFIYKGL